MRITILFFSLLCLSLYTQAQSDKSTKEKDGSNRHKKWKQGFVVTVHGDTIRGKMRDEILPPFYDMQYEMGFDNRDGITKHYTPDSLRSFAIFRSQDGRTDTAVYVPMKIDDAVIGHAFFRLYIDAPCKVYGYITVVPTGSASVRNVEYKYIRIGNGSLVPPARAGFIKDMKGVFSSCPLIIAKLESKAYTISNWEDMVRDYNKGLCK